MANATAGRIVILAVAIVVLWLGGAVAGTLIGAYPTFSEAVWDAIWHMLDPGALGDDATTKQRALGVALTIAGLIILAGAALTLFEELVERALGRLGAADPPLSIRDHLLVIGANKTLTAIVRRVADEGPEGGRPVVVLVPPGDSAARRNLARELAAEAGRARVRVVGGELADDGLERVCAADAARIVVLAPPDLDPEIADLRVLGVGTRLASAIDDERRPPVSLQMSRGRNVDVVWDQFPEVSTPWWRTAPLLQSSLSASPIPPSAGSCRGWTIAARSSFARTWRAGRSPRSSKTTPTSFRSPSPAARASR